MDQPMSQFKYSVLPPCNHGGKWRAFLFLVTPYEKGIYGYAGTCTQQTVWMRFTKGK